MHKKDKILFIDDSKAEITYLELFFQVNDFSFDVDFNNSAQDALQAFSTMNANQFPDFIIVDINMPLMNGFEFAEKFIALREEKQSATKLFIYSTSIHSKDIMRVDSIKGVTGFISKPFDQKALEEHILPHMSLVATSDEV